MNHLRTSNGYVLVVVAFWLILSCIYLSSWSPMIRFTATKEKQSTDCLDSELKVASCEWEKEYFASWEKELYKQAHKHYLCSVCKRTAGKKFLTIGISTVYREKNYIVPTLHSLLSNSDDMEKRDVILVINLADSDQNKREKQRRLIETQFKKSIISRFIEIIEATDEIYPPMDFAVHKRTFNDSIERVIWRTKQVIDFAFIFTYAKNMSDYYLLLEDDVIASYQYITAIKEFIETRPKKSRWVALHFTGFLGIGLLFKNNQLASLVKYLLIFHQDRPVDMLIDNFISLQVPDKNVVIQRIPSLFQHIGLVSTLPQKVQKLTDSTFQMADRVIKNLNPPADIFTTMSVFHDFRPEYAYKATPGFFWGIAKPEDTYDIVLHKPTNITRLLIFSGLIEKKDKKVMKKDIIIDGSVLISNAYVEAVNKSAVCKNFMAVGKFIDGKIEVDISQTFPVQCIQVRIGHLQKSWVILREIEIIWEH